MKKIFSIVTWVIFGLFWVSVLTLDCESWTPFIVCIGCWIYLAFAAHKMGWYYDPEEDEEDV